MEVQVRFFFPRKKTIKQQVITAVPVKQQSSRLAVLVAAQQSFFLAEYLQVQKYTEVVTSDVLLYTLVLKEDHSGPSRPVPSPANSNTFPLRNPPKSLQKPFTLGASSAHAESFHSGSLPPQSQQGDVNRSYSQAEGKKVVSKYGIPDIEKQVESSLDEDWYVGNINRQDAEEALRTIDQDGTFLVRNSSKKTTPHPFVLMVLFNDKVYNVQIRYDQRQSVYMLGTGGKEHFQSVSQMIDYFTRTPLLLIDGKDRDLRYQCLLKHSAGRV
ncbi:lymphocyte cytosolic protein 2-like [Pleurodeles waltl]|uniref:lymphocyte cytosolic protein 2-like n=1 Tax=Pleurodeles waltl TaxID=8319 RepID=UPI0037098A79